MDVRNAICSDDVTPMPSEWAKVAGHAAGVESSGLGA